MRRSDREVTDIEGIRSIIERCKTCHVAMIDNGMPYVLPLSFGYALEDGALTLYFHSAKEGRKLDILRRYNRVCFEMCFAGELILGDSPCNTGYDYASVIGIGEAKFIENAEEKRRALSLLMERQTGEYVEFTDAQAESVCVFKIVSSDFSGKRKPRPGK